MVHRLLSLEVNGRLLVIVGGGGMRLVGDKVSGIRVRVYIHWVGS